MKVKRYEAPTLQEAVDHVKQDMGMDAVILQTRKFTKGGIFGIMGKEMVEVLAGLDSVAENGATASKPSPRPAPEPALRRPETSVSAGAAAYATTRSSQPKKNPHDNGHIDQLRDEMREMRNVLKTLISQQKSVGASSSEDVRPFPPVFGDIYLRLLENDIEVPVAQDIIRSINEAVPLEDSDNAQVVAGYLNRHLRRLLKVSGEIQLTAGSPKTVAFVGPTGVGKTTTIAKLATHFALARRKKVGLITADTYRIAAVEQIKVYGDIIDIPVRVVYNNEDMKNSLDFFSDRDLILIDTAGRSHRSTDKLHDLKDVLTAHFPQEIHLVLNANLRVKELMDIAESFRMLPYNHIIFTKLDEASTYGNILNVITKFNVGVSYICYGQGVPEEFVPATYDLLVDLTMGKPIEKCVDES